MSSICDNCIHLNICGKDGIEDPAMTYCSDRYVLEENGDLISREALKKEVENLVVGGEEGLKDYYENGSKSDENAWIGGVYDAWELINNAPTVPLPDFKSGYKQAIIDGKTNFSRPQGEWIDTGSGQECNVCHEIQYGYDNFRHFCANCGADMRKGVMKKNDRNKYVNA